MFIPVISVISCLVAASYAQAVCNSDNEVFQQGDIFTTLARGPCVKYMCDGGVSKLLDESCLSNGVCYAINSTWISNCYTYKCVKKLDVLSINTVKKECIDHNGKCFAQGVYFPYLIDGQIYPQCTCYPNPSNPTALKYLCQL